MAGHLGLPQYAPLLAGADIGVSPYCGWPEFSGLKVLDYKAAGLPTIASGINGHPPTLKTGETGLIVPPCSVEALCDAIVRLCADSPQRRRMGQAARLEAEAMHGWDQTADRLVRIFRAVLTEARK
jgi:glycosyltransferase involved in cell wall biosynthesis